MKMKLFGDPYRKKRINTKCFLLNQKQANQKEQKKKII